MALSVFTRHSSGCKLKRDRLCRRCSCPKWVAGQINGEYFRQSASTRIWEEAERFCESLQAAFEKRLPPFGPVPAIEASPQPGEGAASRPLVSELPPAEPQSQPMPPVSLVPSIRSPLSPVAALPLASIPELIPPPVANGKPRILIDKAVDAYMTDARSRGLAPDTINKLENIFRKQLLLWCKTEGLLFLDQLDLDALLSFRSTWTEGALVRVKKQERVIGFFWACFRRNYIQQNPALGLSKIRTHQIPTDYFPRDEFAKIIAATYVYGDSRGGFIPIEDTRGRLRTLTLLMRWSGLRIRDAVILERHRLHEDSLLLYQAKTGQPVYVPLPPNVAEALRAIPEGPKPNPRYFFWSGNGLPKSAVADWQRSYRRLFEIANIRKLDGEKKRCHPHMFRDTFAVEMLLAGVPIDQVSILLGHSSVKITEKHYAPFVKARQLQLQASVPAAWNVGGSSSGEPDTAMRLST
jgi:integrase/recombinase XerD